MQVIVQQGKCRDWVREGESIELLFGLEVIDVQAAVSVSAHNDWLEVIGNHLYDRWLFLFELDGMGHTALLDVKEDQMRSYITNSHQVAISLHPAASASIGMFAINFEG